MHRFNLLVFALALCVIAANSSDCRCLPGDSCWPSSQKWDEFNVTLGGRLISTVPLGSVCHTKGDFAAYDKDACANLIASWGFPATHYTACSSPMASWFSDSSCSPFTPQDLPCTSTALQRYTVNVSGVEDVQRTIQFARDNNIRLVIRNTGHDYLGKSTAPGGLALWMHHLKDTRYLEYFSDLYNGPALRLGAGIQGFDGMTAAHAQNKIIVTGNCESVGISGGYSQGGGHGQLASRFGLAADQVLEWEVVTAAGQHLIVSPNKYSDLFWALSGGGGGTFAVVMSVTVKAHPEVSTASANLTFSGKDVAMETFWNIIQTFIVDIAPLVDTGAVAIWAVVGPRFTLSPVSWPGGTVEQLQDGLASTLDLLDQNNITYDYHIGQYSTFWNSYAAMNPHNNITEAQIGGWLMSRSILESDPAGLIVTLQGVAELGAEVSGISLNVSRSPAPFNAIHPAWRETAISVVLGMDYNYTNREHNIKCQSLMTDVLIPRLTAISPDSGAYLNEGDWKQPNWQSTFYGRHYANLREIKDKYDPDQLFYARTAVGSELWYEQKNGRLCRT